MFIIIIISCYYRRGQHTRLVSNSLYLLQLMMLNAPSEIKDLVANSFEEDMLEASAKNANTDFTSSIPYDKENLIYFCIGFDLIVTFFNFLLIMHCY